MYQGLCGWVGGCRLYVEEIDLGEGAVRQVVSGLAKFLTEEQFVVREGQRKGGCSGGQGGCAILGKADLNLFKLAGPT